MGKYKYEKLTALILIEFAILLFLSVYIHHKKINVLGTSVSVNPLQKEDLIFSDEELEYFYEPQPNNIITEKPTWLGDDYNYITSINSDALNERFDYFPEKPQDVFRIVTLGDSFTYGQYVSTKENYPEKLEDLLNKELTCSNSKKFEVINLGVGGYDIEYSVHRFKTRGQKYNPDLVLWWLKNDDFEHINEIMLPMRDFYYKEMEKTGELEESYKKGDYYPFWTKVLEEFSKQYKEKQLLDLQASRIQSLDTYYKGPLIFLAVSSSMREEHKLVLRDFTNERKNTYFYESLPGYSKMGKSLSDGHPNAEGYTLISNEVFKILTENHLLPCN